MLFRSFFTIIHKKFNWLIVNWQCAMLRRCAFHSHYITELVQLPHPQYTGLDPTACCYLSQHPLLGHVHLILLGLHIHGHPLCPLLFKNMSPILGIVPVPISHVTCLTKCPCNRTPDKRKKMNGWMDQMSPQSDKILLFWRCGGIFSVPTKITPIL